MDSGLVLDREGVRLTGLDCGGKGTAFLLLHGLAGCAGEWVETAGWLRERGRVVALDLRGHGGSERSPQDVSPAAHVADGELALERWQLAPAVLIGQSFGGLIALRLGAACPGLVRGLVLIEAGPADGGEGFARRTAERVAASLRLWPVPFATREAAIAFWGGPSPRADAWASGLDWREDGGWPRFDIEVMVQTIREASIDATWDAWERIACPVLVVHAARGAMSADYAKRMADRGRDVRVVEITGAGHDLHLDSPGQWRAALSAFIDAL